MIRTISAVLCFFLAFNLSAVDIEINIKPISPFKFSSSDAFTYVLVLNNTGTDYQGYIVSEIRSKGRPVVEYRSSTLNFKAGMNDLSVMQAALVSSKFMNEDLRNYDRINQSYPSGNYTLCVVLYNLQNQKISESCEDFELQLLNPPVLNYPDNGKEVEENDIINFTWVPCTPYRKGLTYNFKLVEVMKGQQALDAISRNPPVHTTSGLKNNLYTYPVNAIRLVKGKKYAWQVECIEQIGGTENNPQRNSAVASDAFHFIVGKKEKSDTVRYAVPRRQMDGGHTEYVNGSVYFVFESEYASGILNYELRSPSNKPASCTIRKVTGDGKLLDIAQVERGSNKYKLVFNNDVPEKGIYVLELRDEKNIISYLKIKVN